MIFTVIVILAIGLVVFFIIGYKVIEGEAIMGCNEIYTGRGTPVILFVQVRATCDTQGEFSQHTICTSPVIAYAITVLAIPFSPTRRKFSNLVSSFAYIPWFSY